MVPMEMKSTFLFVFSEICDIPDIVQVRLIPGHSPCRGFQAAAAVGDDRRVCTVLRNGRVSETSCGMCKSQHLVDVTDRNNRSKLKCVMDGRVGALASSSKSK